MSVNVGEALIEAGNFTEHQKATGKRNAHTGALTPRQDPAPPETRSLSLGLTHETLGSELLR